MLIHVKSLRVLLFPQNKKARELLKNQLPPGLLSLRDTVNNCEFPLGPVQQEVAEP